MPDMRDYIQLAVIRLHHELEGVSLSIAACIQRLEKEEFRWL